MLCSWTIHSIGGHRRRIHVDFKMISIWPTFNCLFDGLILLDGNSQSAPMLGMYCTGSPLLDVTTTGPSLHIIFYSSDFPQRQFRGFLLEIKDLDPEVQCKENQLRCHNMKCISKTLICDGKDDCLDGTDEESCEFEAQDKMPCGRPPIRPQLGNEDRIVGGRAAVPGSWPWQCSLRRRGSSLYGHLCGAVLVNDRWLLTAAHCFRELRNASLWTVHMGKYYKEKEEPKEQVRYIKKIFIHPEYTGMSSDPVLLSKKDNDIALVQLNAPVYPSSFVRPVCMIPWMAEVPPGQICHVTGWGATLGTGSTEVLKQAAVPIVSRDSCQAAYNRINITSGMICAGYRTGGHDSCKGDSGGPLVLLKNDIWYLVGLVSTGENCAAPMQPGIYTRVAYYRFWIYEVMRINK